MRDMSLLIASARYYLMAGLLALLGRRALDKRVPIYASCRSATPSPTGQKARPLMATVDPWRLLSAVRWLPWISLAPRSAELCPILIPRATLLTKSATSPL